MKAQINITEDNEKKLKVIKSLGIMNNISVNNKEDLLNFSIKTLHTIITNLDDESLLQVCNLKKSI